MKIGYPCINRSLDCTANHTFRLKSYSRERLYQALSDNLDCLERLLGFNVDNNILFFRISSDLVPFASHPVCTDPWFKDFAERFARVGTLIRDNNIRISMHPDQFIVLNSNRPEVVVRSIAELDYHARVLDLMGLDTTAKIQLHAGGVYGDRPASMERFCEVYRTLDGSIRSRLVIENDDRQYPVADCLYIHEQTGVPILLDTLHHKILNRGESLQEVLAHTGATWKETDGIAMLDYSCQEEGARVGKHCEAIGPEAFARFLQESRPFDFDIMLEIKNKELSAKEAIALARSDSRFRAL